MCYIINLSRKMDINFYDLYMLKCRKSYMRKLYINEKNNNAYL